MRQTDISTERISITLRCLWPDFISVDGGDGGEVTGEKSAGLATAVQDCMWAFRTVKTTGYFDRRCRDTLSFVCGNQNGHFKLKHGLSPTVDWLINMCATVSLNERVRLAAWHRFSQLSHLHYTKWLNKLTSCVKGQLLLRREWKQSGL